MIHNTYIPHAHPEKEGGQHPTSRERRVCVCVCVGGGGGGGADTPPREVEASKGTQ